MIKAFGIRWNVHPLFVLVMLASVATGYFTELAVLFSIVIVHELGHVLTARSFGWHIREIKLLPFGGVAETDEAGAGSAWEEAAVAAAGPLQNVWMAAAAWMFGEWLGADPEWTAYIVRANVMIGLFNLIPILPLDGGKLMQALFSSGLSYRRTLEWGARVSLLLSGVIVLAALYSARVGGVQLNLLTVGLFLLVTNWTYMRNVPYVFIRFLMHRARDDGRMSAARERAEPIVVGSGETIGGILRRFRRGKYHLIYVTGAGGTVVGVLPEERLIERYLDGGRPGSAVSEFFM